MAENRLEWNLRSEDTATHDQVTRPTDSASSCAPFVGVSYSANHV